MDEKTQNIWHAKRLINLASKAALHTSKRIRAGLPVRVSLARSNRLIHLSAEAWHKATA